MAAFKENSQGKSIVRNIDNVVRLEDFLHSQFGDNKKLNIADELK